MPADPGAFSILGADVEVTGNIEAAGDVHIDGTVRGNVTCRSLIVGEKGMIVGDITADDAKISGATEGNISASQLVIAASAITSGEIEYDRITIEAGARTDGTLRRRDDDNGLKLVSDTEG
ncbi:MULTISPECIES: bactofilin family protein [Pacificimonas]|nr:MULTISPECIES: polymer-forming cytoskeletal protein [Pacificimonas]MBZ6379708.1 polymer-forming cytoskeletal protein [Pacificimonas aurantium]